MTECFKSLQKLLYLISGVIVLLDSGTAAAAVSYTIRFPNAKNHYAEVELRCDAPDGESFELMMPTWTPGSYLIREYARNVETISAADTEGKPIDVSRSSKNRWLVDSGDANSVVVKYRLYCREMTVRTNWVETDFALINGASTFLTPVGSEGTPYEVSVELPDDWKDAVCPLPNSDGSETVFIASNFDELVDSPILCGNPAIYPFEVGGREHLLVSVGEGSIWDGHATARDLEKIVAEHQRMWGITPYPRYVFFNLLMETGGGLEHDNSTVMMISRWYYREREKYVRWLGLASHEFFHTWNVRRLRPKALTEYDYESEVYFRSLWIAEGITSYYDDVALARSGLISQKEYFGLLTKQIERLQSTPGRLVQSLSDSSHDTWIKLYRPNENSKNSQVSYYNKGAVAAFLLDAEIRRVTEDQKSLDDVMRMLYDRHAGEVGYTPDDFRRIVGEVSGQDLTGWFGRFIDGVEEFDYAPALDWYGLAFPSENSTDETSDEDDSKADDRKKAWLGLTTEDSKGRLVITEVRRDAPAFDAGFNVGDEILAIDDYRVTASEFEGRLKQYQAGDSVEFLIARREKLQRLRVAFGEAPGEKWKISVVDEPSEEQKQHLANWLQVK